MIASNISAAPADRPATSKARSSRAAILSRDHARGPIPNPPQQQPFAATLFAKAARELGYKPFPQPSGNMSRAYQNPLGVRLGPCTFCGFCEWFGCGNYSKSSPQTTILPALMRKPNFSARDNCEVTRINLDASGKRATGVTFVDTGGNEWEQPADLVILSAYHDLQRAASAAVGHRQALRSQRQFRRDRPQLHPSDDFRRRQLLRSREIHFQSVHRFRRDRDLCIDEFNGDNFDHGPHGFVGGGYMGQVQTNGRPIETTPVPPGTPRWGAQWKKAVKENYQSALKPGTGVHGSMYSYRDVYVDLDPTYKDRFGRPLARITMDFHDNEIKQNKFLTDKFAEIFQAMGAKQVDKEYRKAPYDVTKYQTTHLCGGAIMGTDPSTSALNRYLQSWDVPNLFVMGASAFPQNAGYNPTGTVAALAYWSADAIREQISQEPGTSDQCVARSVIAVAVAALGAGAGDVSRGSDLQDFAAVERGRYLANAADCGSCHTVPGSDQPFAGGRTIETPFGILVSPNITPDRETGIGAWTDDQFDAAVRLAACRNGARLYPAMPFPYYSRMSREDVTDIRAYLSTIKPVANAVRVNRLPFPFNIRASMMVWDPLYFTPGEFHPDASQIAGMESRRLAGAGARRIAAPAIRPRPSWEATKHPKHCRVTTLQGWIAPDITSGQGSLARLVGRGHRQLSEDRAQPACRGCRPDGRGGRSLDLENDRCRPQCDRRLSEGRVGTGAGERRLSRQGRHLRRRGDLSGPLLGLPCARTARACRTCFRICRRPRPSRPGIRPRCFT